MGRRAIKVELWLKNNLEELSVPIIVIVTFKAKLTSASPGVLLRPNFS